MHSLPRVIVPSTISAGSLAVSVQPHLVIPMSWFLNTLPAVQWLAALMAALSGTFAVWSFIERRFKKE